MKFLIKNIPDFFKKNYIKKNAKNGQDFGNILKKIRRIGISTQLGIEGKGDARAYKSNEDR